MSARGYLGAGDLYINSQVNGVFQGWKGPFEASKFEIKANSELKEKTSKGRASYGQVIESVPIPKPFDLNIVMAELDKTGMALALMGTAAAANQTSGSLTAEAMTAKLGYWVPLSKANFNGPLVITDATATTTYVEGTDYTVNREMGWVMALDTGNIIADEALKVSGAYLTITGSLLSGATVSSVRAKFRLNGINFADQSPTIVDVFEAVISSEAAIDFLSDNFNEVPLKGRMKTPAGMSTPFTVEQRTA